MAIPQDKAAEIQRLLGKLATSGTFESVAITKEIENVAVEAANAREIMKLHTEAASPSFEEMKKAQEALLNMSVNEIEWSVRAAHFLSSAGITTVGQLIQKTEADMLKYGNLDKQSLAEIKAYLQQRGLSLGMEIPAEMTDRPEIAQSDREKAVHQGS
jgi:DNA-directed RNA polymerase alpha subunit